MDGRKAARILAAAVLYALAAVFWGRVRGDMGLTHIRLDQAVTGAAAESISRREAEEAEALSFCFWGEGAAQTVTCRETGGAAQVTPVFLAGNPGLLGGGVLAWQRGCLLDEATARALFGTADCGSQRLWREGEAYPVLGTVEAPRPTMLLLAEAEDRLDRLTLAAPPETAQAAGREFLLRWGLQGESLDFLPLWALARNLLLLLPGVLLGRLWGVLGRRRRWLGVLGALGSLWLLGRQLVIPPGFLPSRWSDFSFWGKLWQTQRENALAILFTPPGNSQLQMLLNMVKSMVSSIAAALTALWPTGRESHAPSAR